MPIPFRCVECDKPISQALNGVCEDCETKEDENMKKFYSSGEEE